MKIEKILNSWYDKPVTPKLFFISILFFGIIGLIYTELGGQQPSVQKSFSIITQHYGINSEEIERTITIPLEDTIGSITGIESLKSSSEFSKSRIDIILREEIDSTNFYLELRDRVDRVYANMPSSVQKPRIVTSNSNQRSSFIISFESEIMEPTQLRQYVEHNIKPAFEKIPGVGEIEIGGGAQKEIHILVNEEKITSSNYSPDQIASFIQEQNIYTPLGNIKTNKNNIPVSIDGRFKNISDFKKLILNQQGSTINLDEISNVTFGYRNPESISRVQGSKKITLYIKTGGEANIVSLSKKINSEVVKWNNKGLQTNLIYDQGEKMFEAIKQVILSIFIGMLIVSLFIFIFTGDFLKSLLLALTLPITGLITIGIFSIFGYSIDNYILAGIAIALGIIIDTGIIITESNFVKSIPALLSSTLTSIIVLFPLIYLRDSILGVANISLALLVMIITSLLMNILFMPYFYRNKSKTIFNLKSISKLKFYIMKACSFSYKNSKLVLILTTFLLGIAIFIMIDNGTQFENILKEPIVFAHIEMESGTNLKTVDKRVNDYIEILKKHPYITQIESISRRDNAQLTIKYNEKKIAESDLIKWIKDTSNSIPEGSLFIPENNNKKLINLEITLTGEDNLELRRVAKETLNNLIKQDWVTEGVLHFKEAPPSYVFDIDNNQFPITGISTSDISNRIRWDLQGPVADKWLDKNDEIDVRIMGNNYTDRTITEIKELPFLNKKDSGVPLRTEQLGTFNEDIEPSRIYRNNRQRSVSFSISIKKMNIEKIENLIWNVLNSQQLKPGYAFKLSDTIYKQRKQMYKLWVLLGLALFLIYAVLASEAESFISPLVIISFIPISLAFPITALKLISQPITTSVMIGFIVLTGMAVNNAILIIDQYKSNYSKTNLKDDLIFAISVRLKPLLLTSGTTILGSLPLLFNNPGDFSFLNALSFVMLFGVLGSLFTSLVFLPAITRYFPKSLN
ncbi:efflux RND transporter permease subunit [Spirochaeta cellobiosiphila]|uniref:efflux RND transporter permease subunit n=1 Tax=Spirochaeta cellobiosiphila TaxID=504483 RepID=UPI0004034835|nr:efflux RND transporter permease subunit [Spirochaeta cellobiosiphila]